MRKVDWEKDSPKKGRARRKPPPASPDGGTELPRKVDVSLEKAPDGPNESDEFERDRSFRVKRYGRLDDVTLEALLVSSFVKDNQSESSTSDSDWDKEAEAVFSSPVRGDWFTNRFLGTVFDTLRDAYRERRERKTITEISNFIAGGQGQTPNESDQFRDEIMECLAARLLHHTRAQYLVDEVVQRHRTRAADLLYNKYVKERSDPKVGLSKAVDNFRAACVKSLVSPSVGEISVHDWVGEYEDTIACLKDMKLHPERYAGFNCGIEAVDKATKGFRPGQLTVFVGMHGGFKSTMMLNIAYGLWLNKYNVLYASLEMEAAIMKIKLWCRATRAVSFSRLYAGLISEEGDWGRIAEIKRLLATEGMGNEQQKKLYIEKERLESALMTATPGRSDVTLMNEQYRKFMDAENKLYIINSGQSSKMKGSQIEKWLGEMEGSFRPNVLIVDYLDLVAPEVAYPDRRDQEFGDICKYFRQMGQKMDFSTITAAQFKRGTIDRMRKKGLDSPEKAQFGTDDIAGSNMIGADADNVIMLFREDGGNRLKMFTVKTRYGVPDVDKGKVLQVDPDTCTIQGSEEIEDTSVRAGRISIQEGIDSMKRTGENKDQNPDTMEIQEYNGPVGDDILDGFADLMGEDGDDLLSSSGEVDL